MYGIPEPEPATALLLRHRAVLLALVGAVLMIGALSDQVRVLALVVGLISTTSYVLLARDAPSRELRTVLRVGLVLIGLLVLATALTAIDLSR